MGTRAYDRVMSRVGLGMGARAYHRVMSRVGLGMGQQGHGMPASSPYRVNNVARGRPHTQYVLSPAESRKPG